LDEESLLPEDPVLGADLLVDFLGAAHDERAA